MKKLLSMGLVLALALSLSVTAFAADDKTITTEGSETTIVKYQVNPTFSVTIPPKVKLGETAEIKAENVVIASSKQVEVALIGTSGTSNTFTLKTTEGAEISYTVTKGNTPVSLNDKVLTVNPKDSNSGSTTLSFVAPNSTDVKFAGAYTGTVTFTVSVEDDGN